MPNKQFLKNRRQAFQALGNMQVFYNMMDREDQDLVGMLDILNSHDPCIAFFLESEYQKVIMQGVSSNAIKVQYRLDEELQEGKVTFSTIEIFMRTIKDNVCNEVLKMSQRMN